MRKEANYNIPIYSYFCPIELYGRIFSVIIKDLWYYSIIILVSFAFLASISSSSSYYYYLISFIMYTFISYFMIAWHEFGHAVMIIHENSGIVNMDLRVIEKSFFRIPSVVSHGYDTTNPQNRMIVLGGVVATVLYNPLINIVIYGLFASFLPKEILPKLLFFVCMPFLLFVNFLFFNQSSDLYKLKNIYCSDVFIDVKHALIKDIVEVAKNIAYYCIISTKKGYNYFFAISIPAKKSSCGIWLGNQLIVSSSIDTTINDLKSVPITKDDTNIWFSINGKSSLKDIIERFGFNSIHVLIKLKEKNLIHIKKVNNLTSNIE